MARISAPSKPVNTGATRCQSEGLSKVPFIGATACGAATLGGAAARGGTGTAAGATTARAAGQRHFWAGRGLPTGGPPLPERISAMSSSLGYTPLST